MHAEWYFEDNGQQRGPVTFEELRQRADAGLLRPTDLVWRQGLGDWVPASTQAGIFGGGAPVAIPPRDYDDERSYERPSPAPNSGALLKVLLFGCGGFVVLTMLCCGALYLIGVNAPERAQKNARRWSLESGQSKSWSFRFNQGDTATILISSTTNSDMDLFVFTDEQKMEQFARAPNPDKALDLCLAYDNELDSHCRVQFVAPETQNYWVLLINRQSQQLDRNIANNGMVTAQSEPK